MKIHLKLFTIAAIFGLFPVFAFAQGNISKLYTVKKSLGEGKTLLVFIKLEGNGKVIEKCAAKIIVGNYSGTNYAFNIEISDKGTFKKKSTIKGTVNGNRIGGTVKVDGVNYPFTAIAGKDKMCSKCNGSGINTDIITPIFQSEKYRPVDNSCYECCGFGRVPE